MRSASNSDHSSDGSAGRGVPRCIYTLIAALGLGLAALLSQSSPGVAPNGAAVPTADANATAPPSHAAAPPYGLPNTTTGIHIGLPFDHNTVPAAMAGHADIVFGSSWIAQPPSVYHTLYLPFDRDEDRRYYATAGAQGIAWWQANHPNWIEYRCDKSTVAYESANTHSVPLDTANPAVRAYIERTYIAPALDGALPGYNGATFEAVGFDNFQMENGSDYSGQRCGHWTGARGTSRWVAQYNGTTNDPTYRRNNVAVAGAYQRYIHAHFPHSAMVANFSYDPAYPTDSAHLMDKIDVLFDEQGYTRGNNAPPWNYTDAAWLSKQRAMQAYLGTNGHGVIDINQEPVPFAKLTAAQVQWALANYLLEKNSASYLYVTGYQEYGHAYTRPEYAAPIGSTMGGMYPSQGVYMRTFTNGLTVVNPSSTTSFALKFPAGTFKDLNGHAVVSVTLGPASGLVLLGALSAPEVLSVYQSLHLNKTTVARGGSISGTVTYKNNTNASITVQGIWITVRPPGGAHSGGPYEPMAPSQGVTTVQPGQSVTLTASRTVGTNDPTGQWYAYSTYLDVNGNWQDAPAPDVYFTVTQ